MFVETSHWRTIILVISTVIFLHQTASSVRQTSLYKLVLLSGLSVKISLAEKDIVDGLYRRNEEK